MSRGNSSGAGDPRPLMEMVTGYWPSQCLLTANRIGLFELLAQGPRPADSVAEALGLSPRPTRLLLNACVGLGLLEKDADGFRNHPTAGTFLVPGRPAFLGNAVRYGDDMWDGWTRLEEALRAGAPTVETSTYTGIDPERTRHFVHGMHDRALGIGKALVEMVDLSGRRRLLDLGGGPGTYSALFVLRYPELCAIVLDLPEVVALADEILDSLGVSDRVQTLGGDYHRTELPPDQDVVLISGVFHRESEDSCRRLLTRAHGALESGGLLVVSDVFTDEGGSTPAFAALFGLNMMLSAPDGGVHSDRDVSSWMEEAGFGEVSRREFPPPMPHRVVTGVRV